MVGRGELVGVQVVVGRIVAGSVGGAGLATGNWVGESPMLICFVGNAVAAGISIG